MAAVKTPNFEEYMQQLLSYTDYKHALNQVQGHPHIKHKRTQTSRYSEAMTQRPAGLGSLHLPFTGSEFIWYR